MHVVTWSHVHHPSPDAARFSIQALLFDNLDILFQYGPGNPESGLGSTTGIQNAAATLGLTVTCDAKEIPHGYAILIKPPVLTVTTEVDEDDATASDGAGISLREAIRDAASGTRIEFAAALDADKIDLSVPGGGAGSRITIAGKALALDASGLGRSITISGGGLAVENGRLVAESCTFSNNKFEAGSAIFLTSGATGEVSYCTLSESNATSASGGVILLDSATCTVYGSVFDRNAANGNSQHQLIGPVLQQYWRIRSITP